MVTATLCCNSFPLPARWTSNSYPFLPYFLPSTPDAICIIRGRLGTSPPFPFSFSFQIHLTNISTFMTHLRCHLLQEALEKIRALSLSSEWFSWHPVIGWTNCTVIMYLALLFEYELFDLFYSSLYTKTHFRCSIIRHIRCPINVYWIHA